MSLKHFHNHKLLNIIKLNCYVFKSKIIRVFNVYDHVTKEVTSNIQKTFNDRKLFNANLRTLSSYNIVSCY